ncbi:hypothetical protein [Sediminitomix flava]|uniref:DNA polymerase-3 subunit gamma/tau n=1 Tax=Sediminitomix flava TaxID=379075 RepID=A0A315Z997_SEDFL|nr:hypothetical protein [Sediminitomix flava]PWJ42145.1 hypothetical protein BC781_103395 [Sediminitomix flava]
MVTPSPQAANSQKVEEGNAPTSELKNSLSSAFKAARTKAVTFKRTNAISNSIQDVGQRLVQEQQAQEAKQQKTQVKQSFRKRAFNQDTLEKVWFEYVIQVKRQNVSPLIVLLLEDSPVKLVGETQINVSLTNPMQVQQFQQLKPQLHNFLKDQLQNDYITLDAQVVEVKEGKRLYTQAEKYNYLKEKYPILDEMRSLLGFELDG